MRPLAITSEKHVNFQSWLLCLIVLGLVCLVSSSIPGLSKPLVSQDLYDVTALLNDSLWYGSAVAEKEYVPTNKSCTHDRFTIKIFTDLPHSKSVNEPKGGITGCVSKCTPTQILRFREVPLAAGRYKLSDLGACLKETTMAAGEYELLVGGDLAINLYYPAGATIWQGKENNIIPGHDRSWIQIIKYDAVANRIEGTFEVRLIGQNKEVANFTKGNFKVVLTH